MVRTFNELVCSCHLYIIFTGPLVAVSIGSTVRDGVWTQITVKFVITKSDTMNFPVITIFYVSDCSIINGDHFGYTKQNRGSEGFAITRVHCILLHKNTLSLIETN